MNILIIKTAALGDVLRTTFIAQAMKEKYKKNTPKIYWLTNERATPFFINNPYVDFVLADKNKEKLKGISFDVIINLEEEGEFCKFASLLNPKKIIGFFYKAGRILPSPSAKEWYNMSILGKKPYNDVLKRRNKKTHRQIIGEIVGVDYKKYEPFLRLTNSQRKITEEFLKRYNLSRSDLIIGINSGGADRWLKQLPVKKTAELIDKIYKKFKAKILLFGGPSEEVRNKEILKLINSPVIDTGCGNDLVEFPALLSICSLFITTDSLGLHLALALKRKTIALFGPTPPNEMENYDIGEKIVAISNCIACLKKDCKSMEKIDINEVLFSIEKFIKQKITLLITAFKEPKIKRAIERALNQKTIYEYEIIVSAPDKETLDIVKEYSKKYKNIRSFKDPGKGKSYAINLILSSLKTDILILTDADVYISENAIEDITKMFLDPEIGCVTGRPVPIENRKTKYGFWANFLFESAHKIRKQASESNSFIQCSGYLFAFRKSKINKIPLDVPEDTIIPYFFWEKGYKIGYAENAKVYVKNVDNLKDWIKQKTRTSKAHEELYKYVDIKITPRVKTFKNESKGISWALKYPSNLKEFFWTSQLVLLRLYMWTKVLIDVKLIKKSYKDGWERIESTK